MTIPSKINNFQGPYRFLSNFWPCVVTLDEMIYPSVEHAYQAAKTINVNQRETIRNAKTPGEAKRLGRVVTLREGWNQLRIPVMRSLLRQKFRNSVLCSKLLATGSVVLIEGNTWGDRFWGVDGQNEGENHLGKLLMEIRDEIRKNLK